MTKNEVCEIWNDFWQTVAEYETNESVLPALYSFPAKLAEAMDEHVAKLEEEKENPIETVDFGGDAGSSGGMTL